VVDADYFSTLRIATVKGRVFDSSDRENEPDVVVINQTMAEKLWPGADPVGRSLMAGDPLRPARVIGVVRDAKDVNLDDVPQPAMYYALSQHYVRRVSLIARTGGDPRLWAEPISSTLRAAGVLIYFAPLTYSELLDFSLVMERVIAGAVAVLSGLALLLAVLGLLGSISYSVSERKRELGLRVALGARSSELLGMILRQTLRTTGVGIGIGILLGIGATTVLRSQLYGIGFIEWIVLVAVGASMLCVSLLAASLSAVPWLRVDPMEAVRHV